MNDSESPLPALPETNFEEVVVCPWCGYRHRDSWEFEEGDQQCQHCDKKFFLAIHTEVTYSTKGET